MEGGQIQTNYLVHGRIYLTLGSNNKTIKVLAIRIKVSKIRVRAPQWALEMLKCLAKGELPNEKCYMRKFKSKTTCFTIVDEIVYK